MPPQLPAGEESTKILWTRRGFIQVVGLAGAATSGLIRPKVSMAKVEVEPEWKLGQRFRVVRGADLLSLEIELLNLGVVSGEQDMIHPRSHGAPGYIVLHFPGQHIAEQAIWDRSSPKPQKPNEKEGSKGDPSPPLTYRIFGNAGATDLGFLRRLGSDKPEAKGDRWNDAESLHGLAGAWMSGPSQLVFELPQRLTPIPFDLDEILDLCARRLELMVPPDLEPGKEWEVKAATEAAKLIGPVEPFLGHHDGDLHDPRNVPRTNIEYPSLLHISPYRTSRWRLRPARTSDQRSALFAFELERPRDVPIEGPPRAVRAPGHLFAFGWKPTEEARYPKASGTSPLPIQGESDAKYGEDEFPKTGSYDATRKLLVKQGFEDNGDIIANRLRLSTLGATARLQYRPIIDVSEEKPSNWDGSKKKSEEVQKKAEGEGTLTEWEHKGDDGRDFYSKESFSGYWMPFGLPGEIVTITERLLCSPEQAPAGAVEDDNALVDLNKDESGLTAFLVARKFGRVKGKRIRNFPAPENSEFEGWLGVAGRAVSLSQVYVKHERTPVLANRGIKQEDPRAAMERGEDVVVDRGDGKDAAREILWPRVEEWLVAPDGTKQRKLAVFKFPIEVTLANGTKVQRELPMLFVPTLYKGLELYPLAPENLRNLPMDEPMALAPNPPRAQITAAGLGGGREYGRVKEEFQKLLPEAAKKLSEGAFATTEAGDHSASGTPAVLGAITDGLNVFLGGFREAIDSEVAKARKAIADGIADLPKLGEMNAEKLRDKCKSLLGGEWEKAVADLDERGRAIHQELQRVVAWGREIENSVDQIVAAERLGRLLHPPASQPGVNEWIGVLTLAKEKILGKVVAGITVQTGQLAVLLADAPKDFGDKARPAMEDVFAKLLQTAEAWEGAGKEALEDAETNALLAWRKLQIAWATWLARIWRRKDWDGVFAEIAAKVDAELVSQTLVGLLQKELQQAMLKGGKKFPLLQYKVGNQTFGIALPELPDGVVANVKDWPKVLEGPLGQLERLANSNHETLAGVLAGIQRALPNERGLAQRLQRLIEDVALLPLNERQERLRHWFLDANTHLTFALAHLEDGRVRVERFLASAASGRELFDHWRDNVAKGADALEKQVRKKVSGVVAEADKTMDSVKRLIFDANPDRVRRHLEDIIEHTGGKIETDFREAIDRARNRAAALIAGIEIKVKRAERLSGRDVEAFRDELNELFSHAAGAAESIRGMLEKWINPKEEKSYVLAKVNKVLDGIPGSLQGIPAKIRAALNPAGRIVGWRTGLALADLVESLEARFEKGSSASGGAEAAKQLRAIRESLVMEITKELSLKSDSFVKARQALAVWEGRMDTEMKMRLAAFGTQEQLGPAGRLEYLVVSLWTVNEGQLRGVLTELFKNLGTDTLRDTLGKIWPGATDAANKLRDLAGEGSEVMKRMEAGFKGLSGTAEKLAKEQKENLETGLTTFANQLTDHLKARVSHVEGAAMSMVKRAVVSLPSPTLLSEYQDQSHKVVMEAKSLVFSARHIADEGMKKFDEIKDAKQSLRSLLSAPTLEKLHVKLPSVEKPQIISHAEDYIKQGFRDVGKDGKKLAAGVFADVKSQAETALKNAGMAGVSSKIESLSREAGGIANKAKEEMAKVSGLVEQEIGKIKEKGKDAVKDAVKDALKTLKGEAGQLAAKAQDFIPQPFPKLFDKIPLDKLLGDFPRLEDLPKAISNPLPDRIQKVQNLNKAVSKVDLGIIKFVPLGKRGEENETTLKISAREVIWLPGPGREPRPPDISVRGQMEAFYVEISSLLRINFRSLSFTAENGGFKCTPKLGLPQGGAGGGDDSSVVKFLGPLEFVDNFRKSIGSMISGQNGFKLTFRDDSIFAGLKIALPTLAFGAVTITNLSLGFELGLPLNKGPLRFRFALADQEDTFRVAVSIFTGGGFFALTLASRPELCSIEAAIEAGASIEFNAGVAKGGLSAMFGLYFRWGGSVTIFEGYFRACGNVTVLGFIDISIVIYLAFRYLKENNQSYFSGEASIRIRVKIGFFSKSFTLRYEKRIAGSKSQDAEGGEGTGLLESPKRILAMRRHNLSGRALAYRDDVATAGLIAQAPVSPAGGGTGGSAQPQEDFRPPGFADTFTEGEFIEYWLMYDLTAAMPA